MKGGELKEDAPQWAWAEDTNDHAEGLFDSRQEAIDDVQQWVNENATGPVKVRVAMVHFADPKGDLYFDVDEMLERMDGVAVDNDFSWCESEIYYVQDPVTHKGVMHDSPEYRQADEELREVLWQWAKKWITSDKWVMGEGELLTLEPQRKEVSNG